MPTVVQHILGSPKAYDKAEYPVVHKNGGEVGIRIDQVVGYSGVTPEVFHTLNQEWNMFDSDYILFSVPIKCRISTYTRGGGYTRFIT